MKNVGPSSSIQDMGSAWATANSYQANISQPKQHGQLIVSMAETASMTRNTSAETAVTNARTTGTTSNIEIYVEPDGQGSQEDGLQSAMGPPVAPYAGMKFATFEDAWDNY